MILSQKKRTSFCITDVRQNMEENKMKSFNKLLAVLLVGVVLGGCGAATKDSGFQQMDMKDAAILMEEASDYILLDVRTPEEFEEGHLPGAINVENERIGSEEIPELPKKDQKILVYCRSGNRSKQASAKLVKLGYTEIVEIGGIIDWSGTIETGGEQ